MSYKALIFDLDGTLLNTISDISDSFNAVLKANDYPQFCEEEYKYFVGKGIDVLVDEVIKANQIDHSEFEKLKQAYFEEYDKRHDAKTHPYKGIMDLLKELNEKKILLNVLSNKPHSQTLKVVEKYFPGIRFENVYGKKPEFRIKPHPESVLDIISRLGMKKTDILYVGDTSTDIETAKNAGLTSVGVLWGFRKRQELEEAGADFIVEKAEEILKIVAGD